jgi:ABC-type dipeptide/oligopeptide/nickel transport system permease subunit
MTQQTELLAGTTPVGDLNVETRRRSNLWQDAAIRFFQNKLGMVGLGMVTFLVLLAVFGPMVAPKERDRIYFGHQQEPPSSEFWLGTDFESRDMFTRLIYGGRVALIVGLCTQVIILLIGVTVGAIAGYFGGTMDTVLMRVVDVWYAVPALLFAILLMIVLGRGIWQLFIAIGLVQWVTLSRLVRAQFLSLREKEFVKAARVSGTQNFSVIARHLLPNSITPIIVAVTFGIPTAIFTEATLSFFGVGINPPTPSWGQMVGQYSSYLRSAPHMAIFPALCIAFTMLGFTFFGDGLRDALDPKMNR